jgi:adenine phosphoribosyltransferase
MNFKRLIRDVADFPQDGVLFRDITPLLAAPAAFDAAVDALQAATKGLAPTAIVAIESRGFLFGAPLAMRMNLPLVLVRKPGKLPSKRMSVEYSLEYGQSQLDIHEDALTKGDRAFIVDDVLATGGTARAAAKLVELLGATVAGFGFLIELDDLGGRAVVGDYHVASVVHYGALE